MSGPALEARLALKQAAGRLAHDRGEAAAGATLAWDEFAAFQNARMIFAAPPSFRIRR